MAPWPFRRKSRRKRLRASTTDFEEVRGREAQPMPPARSHTLEDVTMATASPTPEPSAPKQRPEPKKLQRKPRTYSFSPGRNDTIKLGRRMSARDKREAARAASNPVGEPMTGLQGSGNDSSLGMRGRDEDVFQRVPTLHNKRDGDHLPRKKSSKKRRKNDPQREAEIKAMSNFMPFRAATDDWNSGRPLRRESRRIRTGFALGFKGNSREEWDKYNRSSDMSLPAESIHSLQSSDSEHISFKVSALEALAPRPTLRYATHPRPSAGSDGEARLVRGPSQRLRNLSAPIPEETLKAHKRIHDLADDLSASDLRELMERDHRRRERRRQRDQEKLEEKLARRAEKQKAAEVAAKEEGRDSPPNLDRGVMGRELVGLGIDSTSAVVTSSRIRQPEESPKKKGKRPEVNDGYDPRPHPLTAFHRTTSIPLQSPPPPAEPNPEPIPETKPENVPPPLTSPRSRSSFLRLGLSRSKSPQDSDLKTEHSEPLHKGSETSSSKGLSWTSFFKWRNKKKRTSAGPSSFSNTSRDSMQTAQLPTPPVSFVPRRVNSGVPKRTMSRFREDLPELPLSPPDSRIQSPEAEPLPDTIIESSPDPGRITEHVVFAPPTHADRYGTPTSEQRSMEAMRQTPSTFGRPDEPSVSPELQTMSLASIDSEGSWLSGRLSKKRQPSSILQSSPYGHFSRQTAESDTELPQERNITNEDVSITDDDYLSRLAPSSAERPSWNRKSTGEPRPSSDGEEETHWGSVRGHQPLVVHSHTAGRVKSREGLLKAFGEEGEIDVVKGAAADNDSDEDELGGEGMRRATSINLGKGHVRHISAGSARLLSISPRSSVDTKRRSLTPMASQERTKMSFD